MHRLFLQRYKLTHITYNWKKMKTHYLCKSYIRSNWFTIQSWFRNMPRLPDFLAARPSLLYLLPVFDFIFTFLTSLVLHRCQQRASFPRQQQCLVSVIVSVSVSAVVIGSLYSVQVFHRTSSLTANVAVLIHHLQTNKQVLSVYIYNVTIALNQLLEKSSPSLSPLLQPSSASRYKCSSHPSLTNLYSSPQVHSIPLLIPLSSIPFIF